MLFLNIANPSQMLHGTDRIRLPNQDRMFDMSLPYNDYPGQGWVLLCKIIEKDERPQLEKYRGLEGFEDLLIGTWVKNPGCRPDIHAVVARLADKPQVKG